MSGNTRTVHLVSVDDDLVSSARDVLDGLEGWELSLPETAEALLESPPAAGDAVLLDGQPPSGNVYETCRRLTGKTRCRTWVVVATDNALAEPIAHFVGATGVLRRPLEAEEVRAALATTGAQRPATGTAARGSAPSEPVLPEALLRDLQGNVDASLVHALTDPETDLFNYAFLNYKIDEEFKRAQRFHHPLSCLMLGFEGQASQDVLRELCGIFLSASRDTDILGRFDENSFLFLLPHTGPDGAVVMARRVVEVAERHGLRDLVGDPLKLAVGISFHPHPEVAGREDLFGRARDAFLAARRTGVGVATSSESA